MCADENYIDHEQFLAKRREEGLKIDPETAEVTSHYTDVDDPYGFFDDGPQAGSYMVQVYFARRPDSDIWVQFSDLPGATSTALWEKHLI